MFTSYSIGYLPVTAGRIVGTLHTVKQVEVVEGFSGNLSGSLHFSMFGIHYDILSGHVLIQKIPGHTKSTAGALFT